MERDPRDRFEEFEELRFGEEPEGEPQPEPDEQTTFDRARFDVFDSDPEAESELVFTPESDTVPAPESPPHLETAEPIPDELPLDPAGLTPPDWLSSDLDPLDDDTPFELLTLDVFDEDEDDLE